MKNNNNLIIENKAPIEIVQELKSEYHQTYEEFMKTYQTDTNYSDLNHNDIREVRGYGPCTDGRNKDHCHCSNEEIRIQIINNTYWVLKRLSPPGNHQIKVNFITRYSDEKFFSNNYFWLDLEGDTVGWGTTSIFNRPFGASNFCKYTSKIDLRNFAQLKRFKELLETGATPNSSNDLPQIVILEERTFGYRQLIGKTKKVANKAKELIERCKKWQNIDGDFEF